MRLRQILFCSVMICAVGMIAFTASAQTITNTTTTITPVTPADTSLSARDEDVHAQDDAVRAACAASVGRNAQGNPDAAALAYCIKTKGPAMLEQHSDSPSPPSN